MHRARPAIQKQTRRVSNRVRRLKTNGFLKHCRALRIKRSRLILPKRRRHKSHQLPMTA